MVRIWDVAKHAGVSVASVSRTLAGKGPVSESVRQKVLESVKILGYRPNLAARRLRSRQTNAIGLLVSDVRNPFFTEISRAIEEIAFGRRVHVILCNTDDNPKREAACLDLMRDENVAGAILSPTLNLLSKWQPSDYPFPVVLVDRCESRTVADAVVLDNFDAAFRLTEHLISNGHQRVTFIYGSASATGRQRLEGYVAAMKAHRLPTQAVGVRPVVDATRAALREIIEGQHHPQAVVASSGLVLLGVVEELLSARIAIPRDIAVAGFDDLPWTRLVTPGITVIAQPTDEIGREAIGLLLKKIATPTIETRRVVLRGELIVRGSSAPRSSRSRQTGFGEAARKG